MRFPIGLKLVLSGAFPKFLTQKAPPYAQHELRDARDEVQAGKWFFLHRVLSWRVF